MGDASFNEFVREQLAALPGLEFRRMFGGEGIYQADRFYGILYQGRLYFKTDALTRADYDAAGMGPFQPNAKQCLSAYREVPASVLENSSELCAWAGRAAQCGAETKRAAKPTRARRR